MIRNKKLKRERYRNRTGIFKKKADKINCSVHNCEYNSRLKCTCKLSRCKFGLDFIFPKENESEQ